MGTVTDITNRPRRAKGSGPFLPFGPRRAGLHKPPARTPLGVLSLALVGASVELEFCGRASCGHPISLTFGASDVASTVMAGGGEACVEVLRQILGELLKAGPLKHPCSQCLTPPGPGLA